MQALQSVTLLNKRKIKKEKYINKRIETSRKIEKKSRTKLQTKSKHNAENLSRIDLGMEGHNLVLAAPHATF